MEIDKILFRIRNKRQELNYSQQYIASLLKMNQANYNKIENGKVELSVSLLLKLAEILDVSFEDLLNRHASQKLS